MDLFEKTANAAKKEVKKAGYIDEKEDEIMNRRIQASFSSIPQRRFMIASSCWQYFALNPPHAMSHVHPVVPVLPIDPPLFLLAGLLAKLSCSGLELQPQAADCPCEQAWQPPQDSHER